jgi:hypothetical protein
MQLFLIGLFLLLTSYYLLCLTICIMIRNFILNQKRNPSLLNLGNGNISTANNTKVTIGNKVIKLGTSNKLKGFSNAYNRTIYAIEDQQFEDWIDAIEKIFKMLKKDFFGTFKKFFTFLFNLGKPLEIDTFETRMKRINNQKQAIEMEKMVDKINDQTQLETLNSGSENAEQIKASTPTMIKSSSIIKTNNEINDSDVKIAKPKVIKSILKLKKNEDGEMRLVSETTESDENNDSNDATVSNESNNFEKMEQRILNKLKESGEGNFDIWLSLAEMYRENGTETSTEKAREIYSFVSKNSVGKDREKAINGLIGL